jgi:hypothetical protein
MHRRAIYDTSQECEQDKHKVTMDGTQALYITQVEHGHIKKDNYFAMKQQG